MMRPKNAEALKRNLRVADTIDKNQKPKSWGNPFTLRQKCIVVFGTLVLQCQRVFFHPLLWDVNNLYDS